MSKPVFLDVDPSIVEKNLSILNDPEEEKLNQILNKQAVPSKLVKPSPGFCVKTREVGVEKKVFINICQTDAIPPPKDISVEDLEDILDSEDSGFKIPMSIGEIRSEADKKGQDAKACDVAIHPKFFEKVEAIPLFKSFFLAVVFEGLMHKHGLHCTDDRVILKNRKAYGTLQMHRIEQREINEKMGIKSPNMIQKATEGAGDNKSLPKIETLASYENKTMEPNYMLYRKKDDNDTLYGEFIFPDILSSKHLLLDIGEDRILLESTNGKYLLDIFIPFFVDPEGTSCSFNTISKILTVTMPITAAF